MTSHPPRRRRYGGVTLLFTVATLLGSVAAHADLESIDPAGGAQVDAPPEQIRLTFSEAVEVRFSRFELLPLAPVAASEAGDGATGVGAAIEPEELLRLNGLAGARVRAALEQRAAADAVPVRVASDGDRSRGVTLHPLASLPAGDYVVLWRVLAVDSHTTQGYSVFRVVSPTPPPEPPSEESP